MCVCADRQMPNANAPLLHCWGLIHTISRLVPAAVHEILPSCDCHCFGSSIPRRRPKVQHAVGAASRVGLQPGTAFSSSVPLQSKLSNPSSQRFSIMLLNVRVRVLLDYSALLTPSFVSQNFSVLGLRDGVNSVHALLDMSPMGQPTVLSSAHVTCTLLASNWVRLQLSACGSFRPACNPPFWYQKKCGIVPKKPPICTKKTLCFYQQKPQGITKFTRNPPEIISPPQKKNQEKPNQKPCQKTSQIVPTPSPPFCTSPAVFVPKIPPKS